MVELGTSGSCPAGFGISSSIKKLQHKSPVKKEVKVLVNKSVFPELWKKKGKGRAGVICCNEGK